MFPGDDVYFSTNALCPDSLPHLIFSIVPVMYEWILYYYITYSPITDVRRGYGM